MDWLSEDADEVAQTRGFHASGLASFTNDGRLAHVSGALRGCHEADRVASVFGLGMHRQH